ncbi:hypothetical protein LIP_3068 [Limnochorda pilosa]|uniref:Uncharacterized protein n=1 Tax=Limnochorda pilosa TaxID=1555112 RepID=A0A0K2SPG8_LIMPI|nr:hypothetical protein LIP_3068 [Limnochorda pilosa]
MAFALSPLPAAASGTTSGLTGLVEVKTADVLPPQAVRLSLYYDSAGADFEPAVAFGILPGLEVAVNGSTAEGKLGLGAKIGLLAETARQPGLALGFTWGGADDPSFFGTISKRLSSLWRLHGGVATSRTAVLPFVGVSGLLNPVQAGDGAGLPPITLLIEADPSLQVGTRFNLARGLDATLAIRDLKSLQAGLGYQTSF